MAKRTKKRVSRPSTPTSSPADSKDTITDLSTQALQAEIARRQRGLSALERRRDRLAEQLQDIEAQILELGGHANGGARRRPRNEMTLVEALSQVLDGQEMSVTEATEAVLKTGYQTSGTNFRTIVNQTLLREKKTFRKVSRGVYTTA